jgi:hypothetical protein
MEYQFVLCWRVRTIALEYIDFYLLNSKIYLPFLCDFLVIPSRIYCSTRNVNNVELQIAIPNHILVLSE